MSEPLPPDLDAIGSDIEVDQELISFVGRERDELQSYETKRLVYEHDRLQLENQSLRQDIAERKRYANLLFWLIVGWLGATILIVSLDGLTWPWWFLLDFRVETSVLLALVGSTTANVIGLFIIVANYLFPKRIRVPAA